MNAHNPLRIEDAVDAYIALQSKPDRLQWRDYCASVRADAVEINHPDVEAYMADNPGQFDTLEDALADFRDTFCFVCPVLRLWFPMECGVKINGEIWHEDASTIGHDDAVFDYGKEGEEG